MSVKELKSSDRSASVIGNHSTVDDTFGPFRLNGDKRELRREGQLVGLTPKAFDTLQVLVTSGGHLVEKTAQKSRDMFRRMTESGD